MESYIASLSMSMAQQSLQTNMATGILKKTMESAEQMSAQTVKALNEIPPAGGSVGKLLDVRA